MDNKRYYSSGEFAKKAHITKKTIRYYDEHNILKPAYCNDNGNRYYTDAEFAKMQQILLLKSLGFSLNDIKEMTLTNAEPSQLAQSFQLQLSLVEGRIAQLELVKDIIAQATIALSDNSSLNWSNMLELMNLSGLEQSLKSQYMNSSNISARIRLHTEFNTNPYGWFPWIYDNCHLTGSERILEIGCGDGSFWKQNLSRLPQHLSLVLSDMSEGMVRDVQNSLQNIPSFEACNFEVFGCEEIPYEDNSFDIIIANHVFFYCRDISKALSEVQRVLRPNGILVCSTYGCHHMQEISQLVKEYDDRITLSAKDLYEIFGKENGASLMSPFFNDIEWLEYPDSLLVTDAEALVAYILSCHGNQNQYIVDSFQEFRSYVKNKMKKGFHITKEAGIFVAKKA